MKHTLRIINNKKTTQENEKDFKTVNTPHFEELEERLEMAQLASADVARCGGTNNQTPSIDDNQDVDVQP